MKRFSALLLIFVSLFALVSNAWSQDETPTETAAEETSGTDAAEESSETESTDATDTPADATADEAPAGSFAATFAQWKALLTELRDVQVEYQVAEKGELDALGKKWEDAIARGQAMIPQLRDSALAEYLKAPNTNREVTRLLLSIARDDIARDNYEAVAKIAIPLAENGCKEREISDLAGVSAFATNNLEAAEKYLTAASSNGTLGEDGQKFLSILPEYKELWPAEQKIREAEAKADDLPRVKLTTSVGEIEIELFENEAPETVGNFIFLVEKGFYDGLTFHRVMKSFMAQGGCPDGNGSGGPGYKIYCECVNENHRKHFRGSLSMAKTAARNTGGSQFFLTFVPTQHLNGLHTVFGRVTKGIELLANMQRDPEGDNATKIIKAEVLRKREHEYVPNKVQ